ncbi:MAG: LysR family transcriptional regulator [Bacteriovorax sp.]|nr:LysR family transcriptional regulator [Bacteriovorax sp.]
MKLNNLDLNKIKHFQAVAEHGGLQSGALSLNLTTSAVYQSIKKLEEDLRVHLFYRSGKNYVLTDEGKTLLRLFQEFNWSLEGFLENSKNETGRLQGEIKLGLPLNFSKLVFIPIMKKFIDLHPDVQFDLTITDTHSLLAGVERFELQFAITDDFLTSSFENKMTKKPFFKEELVMICSKPFYDENHEQFSSFKTLQSLPHLGYTKDLLIVQNWYQMSFKKHAKITQSHIIDNVETMMAAIHSGIGLGVVPKDLWKKSAHFQDFHLVEFKEQSLYNQFFLVQESNYLPNTLCKRFLEFFFNEINN